MGKAFNGVCEAFFLEMQPYLIAYLKLVWNLMLIMSLLVLGIRFIQNIMYLLADVLGVFNKFGFPINLNLSMGGC